MSKPVDLLGLYLHLARASQQRNQPHTRDRLMVLAGTIAARMELHRIAALCRREILDHNGNHLVRRWPTFADALEDNDFLHFLKQLQRRYPQEKAERLLQSLGIVIGRERDVYYSDEEYAVSLMGASQQQLDEWFGP